jgi:hypothetical protein
VGAVRRPATGLARRVYERLRVRRPGDRLSEHFHDILAVATRNELLGILQRPPGPAPEPAEGGPLDAGSPAAR